MAEISSSRTDENVGAVRDGADDIWVTPEVAKLDLETAQQTG